MKLIDVAKRIDKSKQNEDYIDTYAVGNELGIDVPYVEQDRLKCFWVGNWCCTDSWVGYRMYFFDDEAVAFSVQTGRKCSENFHWFSEELAIKVRDYLLTLITESDDDLNISVCDINEDIGNTFKIDFSANLIHSNKSRAMLNNEKVEILERIKNKDYGIDTELKIKLPNGEEKHVSIRDLDFEFYVI